MTIIIYILNFTPNPYHTDSIDFCIEAKYRLSSP